MVGTQMIGKGLNFPNVTLVGVLSVDKALFAGDFRSYERTFSLITQVVGRGGRGTKTGRAILQTFMPDHYVLQLAANQNYEDFYREEISLRRTLVFPPVCDICVLGFVGTSAETAGVAARYAAQCLRDLVQKTGFHLPLQMLGPMPFSYGKIGGKYRYRLILKCKNTKAYRDLIRQILWAVSAQREFSKIHVYADMNGDIGV
jgi:primosomal protein N' (replication factor Y)